MIPATLLSAHKSFASLLYKQRERERERESNKHSTESTVSIASLTSFGTLLYTGSVLLAVLPV